MLKKDLIIVFVCFGFFLTITCTKDNSNLNDEFVNSMNIRLKNISPQLTGKQSTLLDHSVNILVEDKDGNVKPNTTLEVSKIIGGGEIISTNNKSDQNGIFSIQWKLGLDYNQQLTIRVKEFPNIKVTANATSLYNYKIPLLQNDGWQTDNIQEISNLNQELIFGGIDNIRSEKYKNIHSVLLILDNKLVLEEYFSGYDSNGDFIEFDRFTPHEQQSASKSFRSMLIGIAIKEGVIENTANNLFSYFPDLSHQAINGKENITLDNILTMSSGLDWNEWITPPNDLSRMYSLPFINWHTYVLERPLAYEPGTKFVYNTGASIMLNRIIENASNTTIAAFTKKYFMDRTDSELLPNNANLQAKKLPRDMAKLGAIYLNKGLWKGNQIVSEEWVERSLESKFNVPEVGANYGYQWWSRNLLASNGISYKCNYASGNGGQFIMIIKELNLVAIFTGGNFSGGGYAYQIMQKHILPSFE